MCHSGFHALSGLVSIQLAKPSFSQMSSHHCIVTRSPNHWCAISCASTSAMLLARVSIDASWRRRAAASRDRRSRAVFSIAPAAKSGTATMSSFLNGILDRVVAVVVAAGSAAPPRARSRSAPSCPASSRCGSGCRRPRPRLHTKSPTASATRYVDIFGVVANVTVCLPAPGPACPRRPRRSRSRGRRRSMVAVSANVALKAGSSNDGNMRRASVASSCVTA